MNSAPEPLNRPSRILIVDDKPQNRRLLEAILTPEGFVVESSSSGEQALASVAEQPPDLILLDVMMPGMDGYNVASRLKADLRTKNIPIVMLTAHDDGNAKMLGLRAGAEDFLTKPVDRAELCVRVRNLLRLKAYGDAQGEYSQLLESEVSSRTADLVESERLYRSTFDAAPVGIVHVGLNGQWLRVNQRLCDMLGYSREELQSSGVQELTHSEEATGEAASLRQMAEGMLDRHVIEEKRYRRRDGSVVFARVNLSVHRDADGRPQHFISVVEDITERRTLEAQVRQASKMEAIGLLASGVAHDFNNILSVVLSYSELLAADLKDGDPMRADLEEIRGAGLQAVQLTRQLLAFSRQQVLEPQIVDLTEIVRGMGKMLGRLIGADVQLSVTGGHALGKILVDPGQMEQVIMNLAVNARDAMPGGGKLAIETKSVVLDEISAAELVGVKPGSHVLLTVKDTGIGMDRATLARMFEPFFTTKAPGKGTGLGLATVFGIVRQSGGAIDVSSEPNVGTAFEIYFPTAHAAAVAHVSLRPSELYTLTGSETILVVENEERVRTLTCAILRKYGYTVLDAQSSGDALLTCEQHIGDIHLLLTDIVMPRMNGRQLATRLQAARPMTRVLYMSGYADSAVAHQAAEDPGFAFLQKPITPVALARKVRETLAPA